jgi:lipoyl(octanoyl) transferase
MSAWLVRIAEPVPYLISTVAMHRIAELRAADEIPDTLVLLEHLPVYTAGRRSDPSHILWAEEKMRDAGAELHHVDRGGSVTFHGPGQLVGYPILDLGRRPDLSGHLNRIEEVVIRSGETVGVTLERDAAQAGVWSTGAKVCAIGVKLARWRVTLHGFGLNCNTDMSWFDAIVPCGLADRAVTSLSALAGREVTIDELATPVAEHFQEVFGCRLFEAPQELAEMFTAVAVPG